MTTRFLEKFRAGEPVFGTMVMWVRTPGIIRMAAVAGFDYVMIDLQHSNLGFETVVDMCEVARAAGIALFIRPSDMSQDVVNRLQDMGARVRAYDPVGTTAFVDLDTTKDVYPTAPERSHISHVVC